MLDSPSTSLIYQSTKDLYTIPVIVDSPLSVIVDPPSTLTDYQSLPSLYCQSTHSRLPAIVIIESASITCYWYSRVGVNSAQQL
mgnify:CR=1 FL=1